MKIKSIIKGFTLIELLVVITIIGILATGGIAIFTKQLQGARDSTRINDIKLLQSSSEMYFSDNDEYPPKNTFSGSIKIYLSKSLKDPKSNTSVCWANHAGSPKSDSICNGYYDIQSDAFGLTKSAMKLGIRFEKEENFKNIAKDTGLKGDGGNALGYYEVYQGAGSSTGTDVSLSSTSRILVY